MRLNITDGYISLEHLVESLNSSSNIKDVYLLCHQAGCPVYILRDINDKLAVIWHPRKDKEENVFNIIINNGVLEVLCENKVQKFEDEENLRTDSLANHMMGDNPFDIRFRVWSREE